MVAARRHEQGHVPRQLQVRDFLLMDALDDALLLASLGVPHAQRGVVGAREDGAVDGAPQRAVDLGGVAEHLRLWCVGRVREVLQVEVPHEDRRLVAHDVVEHRQEGLFAEGEAHVTHRARVLPRVQALTCTHIPQLALVVRGPRQQASRVICVWHRRGNVRSARGKWEAGGERGALSQGRLVDMAGSRRGRGRGSGATSAQGAGTHS